ncbi:MAG: cytochrome P450 [Alphaproteobacteria bacterium]|nr:cytochrome P450 [Alphaproteobacteria bacterium]
MTPLSLLDDGPLAVGTPQDGVFGPNGESEPLDLLDVNLHADNPWPLYTWLREHAPLYQDANGLWHVSRYDDVVHVAMRPEIFTSTLGNRPQLPNDESFIHLDGDVHRKRRGLIQGYFTPSAIRRLEDHVRHCVTELLDDVIEQGSCDFVTDVAARLPVRLICEMTGVPPEHYDAVREALDVFVMGGNGPDWVTEEVNSAFFDFGSLHMMLVDERVDTPKDDFLSLWLNAEIDGKRLTEDQVLWEHTMMMVGGSETTRNAISGGVWMLHEHADQRDLLVRGATDFDNAAEEVIRWTTPFVSMSRHLTQDYTLHDTTMRAGEEVVMLYPPANRDPRKFERADQFDITRTFDSRVLSFGIGRHVCIGAHLARLETRVMLEELCKRMPDWEPAGDLVWTRSSFIRGIKSLPLRWTPGPRVGSGA